MHFLSPQWYETLPSTNTHLTGLLAEVPGLPAGTVVATLHQTAGRGRYERVWTTSPGRDLAMSFLVRAPVEAAWVPSLPMAASLGVARALAGLGVDARLKWPNDVLANGRKICGILSEYVPGPDEPVPTAVVGVGVNVSMTEEEARRIDRPATSILIETGQEWDVAEVLDAILKALPEPIARWESGGFAAIRNDWMDLAAGIGERATVGEGRNRKTGTLAGFGQYGELLLVDDAGAEHAMILGDVNQGAGTME
jgi:BirA family transcriptional regulator, biotin operon repressor / biotin---[acetyl-CoA-carboxylase] ligase